MPETFLSKDEVLNIPDSLGPMLVLSDNIRSLISWGIKVHEKGSYNHFMWLIKGNLFASQNYIFQTQKVSEYLKRFRLKFWYCPSWTPLQRSVLNAVILKDVKRSWYKKLYDPLAIVGQLFHLDFIQTPGLDICSDKADYLRLVDQSFDLKHPDPENVNKWLAENEPKYRVYGRYVPD